MLTTDVTSYLRTLSGRMTTQTDGETAGGATGQIQRRVRGNLSQRLSLRLLPVESYTDGAVLPPPGLASPN